MDYSPKELKEVWARTDEYYQFRYNKFSTFGARLKKWRELNSISKTEMAEAIYYYRKSLGLENNDVSDELLDDEFSGDENNVSFDSLVESKRILKKERRIKSLMHSYNMWESKETDDFFADSPFSMANLRILKKILDCDYEFLFCEIDTPHKNTNRFAKLTGLSTSTIEKLTSLGNSFFVNKNFTSSEVYSHGIITALDKLISDDDLMTYLSWYLTNIDNVEEEIDDEDDVRFGTSSISINRPAAGVPTEDAYMDGTVDVLNESDIHLVYMITIANKLSRLRDNKSSVKSFYTYDLPSLDRIVLANDNDSFGVRLRNCREYNHYTQEYVAELICSYRKDHNLHKTAKGVPYTPEKDSVLRTYQNWESKSSVEKDTRISMTDLFILKTILGCDYEYLFGEINTLKLPDHAIYQTIGLSRENIDKLSLYARSLREKVDEVPAYAFKILSTIDLIVTDNDLLSNLAYYLSDMPFYPNMRLCSVLKPVKIHGINYPLYDEYDEYLFPEDNELRNLFFPAMFKSLLELRKRNLYNHQPLFDNEDYKS